MISTTSEHALRALIELARLPQGEMLLGKDLSERGHIPGQYVSKVLLTLRNAGFLDSVRGSGGGYRLRKPAKNIYLIDIVELFDGVRSRPFCFLDKHKDCNDENPCPAHKKFRKVRTAYIKFLETTSVLELSKATKGTWWDVPN